MKKLIAKKYIRIIYFLTLFTTNFTYYSIDSICNKLSKHLFYDTIAVYLINKNIDVCKSNQYSLILFIIFNSPQYRPHASYFRIIEL